jgi:arylsulfatase A-like enzyme
VENVDIAPTICAYLGVPAHERFQGQSLMGLIQGHHEEMRREEVFYEFYYYNLLRDSSAVRPESCRLWVIRDRRYKYVQFGEEEMPAQLFDIERDPGEFENLAQRPEYATVVADCSQRLLRWRMRNEDDRMERWARQYR